MQLCLSQSNAITYIRSRWASRSGTINSAMRGNNGIVIVDELKREIRQRCLREGWTKGNVYEIIIIMSSFCG